MVYLIPSFPTKNQPAIETIGTSFAGSAFFRLDVYMFVLTLTSNKKP